MSAQKIRVGHPLGFLIKSIQNMIIFCQAIILYLENSNLYWEHMEEN
jgi:hypothetical protein